MKEDQILLNSDKRELRKELIKSIYDNGIFNTALLSALDLEIYDKSDALIPKLNKAIRQSILNSDIYLTNEQMECLSLLEDNSLFISAPTSFGKTYIALEYISRHIDLLNTIVFIVPTVSLMNELRKKCYKYFGKIFKIITSEAELELNRQSLKKLMIFVPERINAIKVKEYLGNVSIDFSVYDEIYKLNSNFEKKDSKTRDDSRLIIMNYAYKYLIENSKKILLLGPFIKDVQFGKSKLNITKYITNLNLVYNEVNVLEHDNIKVNNYNGKEFIYFKSPDSISNFINAQDLSGLKDVEYDTDIIDWMCSHVNKDWYYIDYIKKGIGIHHGNTPLFLRKFIEDEYANGNIHTILCTSTLVEGINTPTDQLIIYDTPRTTFELNNLIGRVGRLNVNSPKKGRVYFTNDETNEMYQPDDWIDLNILYEETDILSKQSEDEYLYLDKQANAELKSKIDMFFKKLKEEYQIEKQEVIDLGIEFKILQKFLNNLAKIQQADNDFEIIRIIKNDIIKERKVYLNGLISERYSFYDENVDKDYLSIDPVYLLLISTNSVYDVIGTFKNKYPKANKKDINLFIDTVFKAEEFVKFQLTKIIPIYELFDSHNLLNKPVFDRFKQCIHKIEMFNSSNNYYERILFDMGFPDDDIIELLDCLEIKKDGLSIEEKLIDLYDNDVYRKLSPFGKRIIHGLNNY